MHVTFYLLVKGFFHDKYGEVKYTDIDYTVVTDASRCICDGSSPYEIEEYRYPPLLAAFLTVTCYCHEAGKFLFILADIVVVVLIQKIISKHAADERWVWFWAVNPLAAIIPTRGSFDSVSNMIVLLCLNECLNKRSVICGAWFGTAVYLRVYPVIYGPALCYYMLPDIQLLLRERKISNLQSTLMFIFTAAATGGVLFFLSYYLYEDEYIKAAITYHFSRLDYRHNFSPHFLWIYLSGGNDADWAQMVAFLLSTMPQAILILISSISLAKKDLSACLLVSTVIFVTFNKVSTAQYFTWYSIFVPIVFGTGTIRCTTSFLISIICWALSTGLWLYFAYLLEFKGLNRYIHVWVCSILLQISSVNVIVNLIGQLGVSAADKTKKY